MFSVSVTVFLSNKKDKTMTVNRKSVNLHFNFQRGTPIHSMEEQQPQPDYIFEVSWEVCNKIGGIYTVLSTKAKTLQKLYKDRIIFIGPDVWREKENPFFKEKNIPALNAWKTYAEKNDGLKMRTGRWDIPGNPLVILVDFAAAESERDRLFTQIWEWYGVDSLHAYGDYDEACLFSYAAARTIESFYRFKEKEKEHPVIVAHFNEWTTGMGELYLKRQIPEIATLFTTHATTTGRSIAGNNKPLYDYFEGYHGDQMSQELHVESKHSLEQKAARNADCFTTVSELTARECTQLLGCTPDVVTPNGFELNFVPKGEAFAEQRLSARSVLLKTAAALIGYKPASDAFLIATAGRYEYKNKGIDLFIDSLRLMKEHYRGKREIIAFILVPAYIRGARADLQERLSGPHPEKTPLPFPLVTHELYHPGDDPVLNHLQAAGISNEPKDQVKVIFVPSYLTGKDGIFDRSYYELLIGFDATVFPSYYEPWGYTPLESIAFGVPTVTTDLSGFGNWAEATEKNETGLSPVTVLHRTDSNFGEVAQEIADILLKIAQLTEKEKDRLSKKALQLARTADWAHFIPYYLKAYRKALEKTNNRTILKSL